MDTTRAFPWLLLFSVFLRLPPKQTARSTWHQVTQQVRRWKERETEKKLRKRAGVTNLTRPFTQTMAIPP